MTIRPRRPGTPLKLLIVAVVATSAMTSSGCGGDDPSQFAGTIEPEPKKSNSKSKSPDARSSAKAKADRGGSNP